MTLTIVLYVMYPSVAGALAALRVFFSKTPRLRPHTDMDSVAVLSSEPTQAGLERVHLDRNFAACGSVLIGATVQGGSVYTRARSLMNGRGGNTAEAYTDMLLTFQGSKGISKLFGCIPF